MNVNVKLSISDEDRNLMSRRLTGKDSKKMVSRAEVNNWVKDQLEKFLRLGSPATEKVNEAITEREQIDFADLTEQDIEDVMKQNKLLQHRINVLQHRLDTTR
jgi:hypothetical protein